MVEKIFHSLGFPVVQFSECTYLQEDIYNGHKKLNFNRYYNTAKNFQTETEALTFIRNAISNDEATQQSDLYRYNIIERGLGLNRLCIII